MLYLKPCFSEQCHNEVCVYIVAVVYSREPTSWQGVAICLLLYIWICFFFAFVFVVLHAFGIQACRRVHCAEPIKICSILVGVQVHTVMLLFGFFFTLVHFCRSFEVKKLRGMDTLVEFLSFYRGRQQVWLSFLLKRGYIL